MDGTLKPMQNRPSALPRSTSSQARLSYIASTRPMPTFAGKSPPLQALTLGLSTTNIPRLDTSRPVLSPEPTHRRFNHSLSPMEYEDDNVFGIAVPRKPATYPLTNLPPRLIPELQALAASNNRPVNPASSSISSIGSPSTQFTTSSSPWSASTAATTPLSWSSASPNVTNQVVTSSKRANTVPVPANVKTRLPKLPAVKETQKSAPVSKTSAKPESEKARAQEKKGSDPMPPPRASSLKGARSRSNSTTTTKSSKQDVARPEVPQTTVPPVATNVEICRSSSRKETYCADKSDVTSGHSRLQEALSSAPRPSIAREKSEVGENRDRAVSAEPPRPRQLLEPLPIAKASHRRFPSLSRRHVRNPSSSEPEVEKQSARSRLAKFSRLALFGRTKSNTETEAKEPNPSKSQPRKGPAAGTGHEGYGKFSRRSRKQSVSSTAAATDSETSIASTTRRPVEKRRSRISGTSQDQSDLDDFASTRMRPVVMLGGSQRGRANPFPPLPKNPQLSDVSLSTMSSAESFPAPVRQLSPRRERFPPPTEDPRPTLATRRSQKFAQSEDSFRIPEPIETQGLTATPALDSRNTTQSSEVATPASAMYRIDPGLLEKQRSKSRKLKWNIFRRKESISGSEDRSVDRPSTRPGMSVNIAPVPVSRPIPYYAMLGSESEVTTTATIGQFLRQAQESPEREDELISVGFSDDEVVENPYVHRESVLLPSAPSRQAPQPISAASHPPAVFVPLSEEHILIPKSPEQPPPVRRQPRLAQVGRIPKVVPTRQQNQPSIPVLDEPTSPVPEVPTTVRPSVSRERLPKLSTRQHKPPRSKPSSTAKAIDQPEANIVSSSRPQQAESDFLRFSDTRNSDFTTSSESSGVISIMGPPPSQWPLPPQRRADSIHHDDEVWHEYNDFMDDIMSPVQQIKSPTKQKKAAKVARVDNAPSAITKEPFLNQGLAIMPTLAVTTAPTGQFLDTPPMTLSNIPSLQEMASSEEIRLRRSRIAAALHASYAPSSPFSMRDFIEEYGRPASGKLSDRLSGSSAPSLTPTLAVAQPQRDQSQPRQYENAAQLEEMERVRNPTKHSDRQYASLMVARWLSFGRVLFSPAHQEIMANSQRHVLVIDGLGSEDWSIYCAVTYQAQDAFVHDLKEKRQGKNKTKNAPSSASAPPNHRRTEISSFNDKFPFPPGFFCGVVVRFPPAMPDSKLKNIISECRRVLSAGGYLELMVLDLDIVNMGIQTRRAIKELKIKMSAADRTISLKPIIDNVQTVLGSNGFLNLSRCVVGVPVVGKPATSLDSSTESRSSSGSAVGHQRRSSAGPRPYGSLGGEANFSLNDLVADHSENADAKIGRMVSRTARSWWQHCFEAGIITESRGSKSVLASKEVLNECKTRAAKFKLLIAYTQKPLPQAEQKRRTMSEPMVPTLATAGATKILR